MYQYALALLLSITSQFISLEDYNKIEIGSTSEFVHGLLGPSERVNWEKGDEICLLWEEDDQTVAVTFKKDRVIDKWEVGLY